MNSYRFPAAWLDKHINVALVGCGGSGGEMFDELYRIHSLLIALGGKGLNVTAYDPDTVSPSNIGRQRFWPADVGFNKAEVLVNRVNNFGGLRWSAVDRLFNAEDVSWLHIDILITCVDSPVPRAEIGQYCQRNDFRNVEKLWLDCGNSSHSGNVILGHLSGSEDMPVRLPNVFELYPMLATMQESNEPSCSTQEALMRQDYGINRSVAREGANLLWQLIRHGSIPHHGSYIDIRSGTVSPLAINESVWATFQSS